MKALATSVMRELAGRIDPDTLVVLTAAMPRALASDRGARTPDVLWNAGGAGDGWAWACFGESARIEATGPDRIARVRACGAALLRTVVERVDGGVANTPSLRLFGGFAFRPGDCDAAPWRAFGDASFTLPRWSTAWRGDEAIVRLALHANEMLEAPRVLAEIDETLASFSAEPPALARSGAVRVEEMAFASWASLVGDALGMIRARRFEKVVPARRTHLASHAAIDVSRAIERMNAAYPTCTRFAFRRDDSLFLGATPERLVAFRSDRVETDALAGSIRRRIGHDEDDAQSLLASAKDRHEHRLVVDGIRAALESSITAWDAPAVPRVKTLRNVHHLWTPIVASVHRDTHVLDLVASLHPTAAVCGIPRDPADAWLTSHEPCARGWYAAPVGWFDASGNGEFVVALRSALVRANEAWLFAGAGVVDGSDAAREYEETAVKQAAMLAALGAAS